MECLIERILSRTDVGASRRVNVHSVRTEMVEAGLVQPGGHSLQGVPAVCPVVGSSVEREPETQQPDVRPGGQGQNGQQQGQFGESKRGDVLEAVPLATSISVMLVHRLVLGLYPVVSDRVADEEGGEDEGKERGVHGSTVAGNRSGGCPIICIGTVSQSTPVVSNPGLFLVEVR